MFLVTFLHQTFSLHNNNNNDDINNNNNNNNTTTTNNNINNNNDNNNNFYFKRVTQSNGKDLPWGPLACLQVARGPRGYKVVQYIAFSYRDLKEGRDGAHLIASVKPFQTLGPEYETHFWPLIYYILEELIVRRLHFKYHSCGFLVYIRKVCSYNGGLTH